MPDALLSAVVAAAVSLLVSAVAYLASARKLRSERQAHERVIAQKFAEELLRHRLRLYPKAFVITGRLGIGDSEDEDLVARFQQIKIDLQAWKIGEVECIMSVGAEDAYQELIERVKRNPERGTKYSKDQLSKLYVLRQTFRGALRRDLGLLHSSARLRLDLESLGMRRE